MEKEQDVFSKIIWTKEDIINLLKEHNKACSDEAIEKFLKSFDKQYFEEKCIQFGWEMLESGM